MDVPWVGILSPSKQAKVDSNQQSQANIPALCMEIMVLPLTRLTVNAVTGASDSKALPSYLGGPAAPFSLRPASQSA